MQITSTLDRKLQENKLILDMIEWLNHNKPCPAPYEYMFTIHNRLSPTPIVAVYVIDKNEKNSSEALGGVNLQLPTQMDVIDGIKELWTQLRHHNVDLREYIPSEGPLN